MSSDKTTGTPVSPVLRSEALSIFGSLLMTNRHTNVTSLAIQAFRAASKLQEVAERIESGEIPLRDPQEAPRKMIRIPRMKAPYHHLRPNDALEPVKDKDGNQLYVEFPQQTSFAMNCDADHPINLLLGLPREQVVEMINNERRAMGRKDLLV